MSKRNLLICFDAFGTLFAPRRPVAQQYAEVAASLGLRGITEGAVEASFKKAFKHESKTNPNYGKANGMNAEGWWTNPLLQRDQHLPSDLVPTLLHRFWSNEGYVLMPDVSLVLRGVKDLQSQRYDRVVVGVITNSDDRVPDILTSLGLKVNPLRYGNEKQQTRDHCDIDFSIMSYDVGFEKPHERIFAAAEEMVDNGTDSPGPWEKVYVGDEYAKDVVGATAAGWNAILLSDGEQNHSITSQDKTDPTSLDRLFASSNAVQLGSLKRLAEWLR